MLYRPCIGQYIGQWRHLATIIGHISANRVKLSASRGAAESAPPPARLLPALMRFDTWNFESLNGMTLRLFEGTLQVLYSR
jgi:hypothetical protein